jgi:CRP-like cAMP-binding protein
MHFDQLDVLEKFKSCDRIVTKHIHLYRTGDQSKEIFNLLSGWVALYRILESGGRQILQVVQPGAFLGYQADLDEPMRHSAICLSEAAVCVFPRRSFPSLLERHPELRLKLADILSGDIVCAHDQLSNIGGRFGIERVAHFLLQTYLQRHCGDREPNSGVQALPLTQEMIGDALGLTQVHTNRILRQLRERGLATIHKGVLEVRDLEGLRQVAKSSEAEAI